MSSDQVRRLCDPFYLDDIPEDIRREYFNPETHRPGHPWTTSGSPIVDGKYIDFNARQVREVQPGDSVISGPPTIDVLWHNLSLSESPDQFRGFRRTFTRGDIGTYVERLGTFFTKGGCKLHSLNATAYSVVVVVMTECTRVEMQERYLDCGLGGFQPRLKEPSAGGSQSTSQDVKDNFSSGAQN